jgi:hypothetical protein
MKLGSLGPPLNTRKRIPMGIPDETNKGVATSCSNVVWCLFGKVDPCSGMSILTSTNKFGKSVKYRSLSLLYFFNYIGDNMWDLNTLKHINKEATEKAKKNNPITLNGDSTIENMQFPFVGNRCDDYDEKLERIDTLFIDISGFGSPSEPALTRAQLENKLSKLIEEHGEILVAGETIGQFQGYLAVWKNSQKPV